MKILISGASGLIGQELATSLSSKGHQVLSLHRNSTEEVPFWNIEKKIIELGTENKIDAVINLAGENIAAARWTAEKKDKILNSRIDGTRLIADYFSKAKHKPKIIISGSAVGYYGDRGTEELDESSPKGTGFLSEVCGEWEAATETATQANIRVVNIRLGMVLSSKGGALAKMVLPFRAGMGGMIGDGKQYISWITISDVGEIINHIIKTETIRGPINLVSPEAVTNYQFTKTLGRVLHRPTILPLPAFLAKIIFGEMAEELLLTSTKVKPDKLLQSGYSFKHPTLDIALKTLLTT
ncbi:MAG: TIGR01777 family oxidoreductase [Desulfuromonadales bacterium]|nr:TIGR01777 family oxidoreductase [Desulfuromonadales bacterium]